MSPGPPKWNSLTSKRGLAFRPSLLPGRMQLNTNMQKGMRFAGAAAFAGGALGLAAAGLRPSVLSGAAVQRGRGGGPPAAGGPNVSVTTGLLTANIVLYGAQVLSKELLTMWGAKVNQLIMAGQYWRLITPAFLHGNLMHLAVNCYSMYQLAPLVEATSGGPRLLAVYAVAAVAGNVASFYGSTAPSLGASGAVFGLGGAVAMYFYRNKDFYGKKADFVLKQLWQTLLINLVYGLANPRIDNWGHLGGLVGGALASYLLGPKLRIGGLRGQRGQFLLDDPPVPILATPPRQYRG